MPNTKHSIKKNINKAIYIAKNLEQAIFEIDEKEKLLYGSDAYDLENKKLNQWHAGRGLYFRDPNGHVLELLTKEP